MRTLDSSGSRILQFKRLAPAKKCSGLHRRRSIVEIVSKCDLKRFPD